MISSAYFTNLASISCGMLRGAPVATLSKAEKKLHQNNTIDSYNTKFFRIHFAEYFRRNTFNEICFHH